MVSCVRSGLQREDLSNAPAPQQLYTYGLQVQRRRCSVTSKVIVQDYAEEAVQSEEDTWVKVAASVTVTQ